MVGRMQSMLPAGLGGQPVPTTALEPDGRTMARAMGALLALAAISLLLWLALPHPAAAHDWPILGIALAELTVAGVLLAGAGDRLAPWAFAALTGLTTVAISIGVYAAGSPAAGCRSSTCGSRPTRSCSSRCAGRPASRP
jgi:hypothetical protein